MGGRTGNCFLELVVAHGAPSAFFELDRSTGLDHQLGESAHEQNVWIDRAFELLHGVVETQVAGNMRGVTPAMLAEPIAAARQALVHVERTFDLIRQLVTAFETIRAAHPADAISRREQMFAAVDYDALYARSVEAGFLLDAHATWARVTDAVAQGGWPGGMALLGVEVRRLAGLLRGHLVELEAAGFAGPAFARWFHDDAVTQRRIAHQRTLIDLIGTALKCAAREANRIVARSGDHDASATSDAGSEPASRLSF